MKTDRSLTINYPFTPAPRLMPWDIFGATSFPDGVIVSTDNGATFSLLNEGLPGGPMGDLELDANGFIYVGSEFSSNFLAVSKNSTVSVDEFQVVPQQNIYTVFPNPADNYITITGPKAQSNLVQVFNMLNQKVLEQNFEQNHRIDVSMLKPGMYLLRINGMSGQTKLMVK